MSVQLAKMITFAHRNLLLDLQIDTTNRSLMFMLFAEDWESVMREFKVMPKR